MATRQTDKTVNFIKSHLQNCDPTTYVPIFCFSCCREIKPSVSDIDGPSVHEFVRQHSGHNWFLEVDGHKIEIPKFGEETKAQESRSDEPRGGESGGDTQVEQAEDNVQTEQVHDGECQPKMGNLNERVLEKVESGEGKQGVHTKTDTELDGVRAKFDKWLKLKDRHIIDVILGTVIANSLEGDPVYLYVVGPPSSGKTEILRSLNDHHTVYYLSSLTPQTLISGWKGSGKFENSLLLKLKERGKTILVLKDFTTILMMRNEARQEILSQVREIADGYYNKPFGTGTEVGWDGKLGMVTGVTLVIDQHHAVHQILGERFLYYRISQDNPETTAKMAQEVAGRESLMRGELRKAVKEFLEHHEEAKVKDISIGGEINEKLICLACFVAGVRTGISRDRYTQAINYLPDSEGPSRLMKQLFTLGCGIAIAQGKNEIDEEVYNILKKVGRDTLPSYRNLILNEMWVRKIVGKHWERPRALSDFLRQPVATIKFNLEELMVMGLANREPEGAHLSEDSYSDKIPYLWRLSDKCYDLIQRSGVYGGNE
jgi:hypothetical protein